MNIVLKPSVLILVDCLRIGGIQRNALDQMYQLSDDNTTCTLIVMNEQGTKQNPNFLSLEEDWIKSKNLDILFAPQGVIKQIHFFSKLISGKKPNLIIDYTVSRTPLLQLSLLFARKKVPVHCVLQQFPSLSATFQRTKRMIYAQFATKLFFNSVNYADDWDYFRRKFPYGVIFKKNHARIRNGVYLPRLAYAGQIIERSDSAMPRFIFLGRLKHWKGLTNLKNIDAALKQNCTFLIFTPEMDTEQVKELQTRFNGRLEFRYGKTLSGFRPKDTDIHIYPVDYGAKAKYVESVSTNCLEMALIGVPSLVTNSGTRNWPELEKLGLVVEVDWSREESITKAYEKVKKTRVSLNDFSLLSQQIDIQNNLRQHLNY